VLRFAGSCTTMTAFRSPGGNDVAFRVLQMFRFPIARRKWSDGQVASRDVNRLVESSIAMWRCRSEARCAGKQACLAYLDLDRDVSERLGQDASDQAAVLEKMLQAAKQGKPPMSWVAGGHGICRAVIAKSAIGKVTGERAGDGRKGQDILSPKRLRNVGVRTAALPPGPWSGAPVDDHRPNGATESCRRSSIGSSGRAAGWSGFSP